MHYCISDVHGWWSKYEKIKDVLTKDDTLYILGDVIDRGKDGLKILLDIQKNENYIFIAGNHEHFLYNYIKANEDNNLVEYIEAKTVWNLDCNGGKVTNRYIDLMDNKEVQNIKNIITNSYLIKRVEINGEKFHLSHSFTLPYIKEDFLFKDATQEERYKILWGSIFPRKSAPFGNIIEDNGEIYIFGHTPVQKVRNDPFNYNIIHGNKNAEYYDIDCGCGYQEEFSRLALFCIEDKKVIYI